MRTSTIILLIAAAGLFGCEKSFETFTPTNTTTADTVWAAPNSGNFSAIAQLHESLMRPALTDSFDLTLNSVVEFPDNVRILIGANSFTNSNGTTPDGKAVVQFQLLKKKGDLIGYMKPTQSNGYLLESGGVVYLNVLKNGVPLLMRQNAAIKISYRDPAPIPGMGFFYGATPWNLSSGVAYNWIAADSLGMVGSVLTNSLGYDIYTSKLNWINCDRFRDTAEQKTRIALTMPAEFTNTNTSVWIVFKSIRSAMLMDGDVANRIWKKNLVPINRNVMYVTVTKKGTDSYYLGIKEATTAMNQNIEIRPEKKTLAEIKTFLDGL